MKQETINKNADPASKEEKANRVLEILDNKDQIVPNIFKNPFVKFILISATVYGVLYVSRYFINSSAETIRAIKNFKRAIKE